MVKIRIGGQIFQVPFSFGRKGLNYLLLRDKQLSSLEEQFFTRRKGLSCLKEKGTMFPWGASS
jgi:hypothetical protein